MHANKSHAGYVHQVRKELVPTKATRTAPFKHRSGEVRKAEERRKQDKAKVQPPKPERRQTRVILVPSDKVQYTYVSDGKPTGVRVETPHTNAFERVVMGVAVIGVGVAAWLGLNGELRSQTKSEVKKDKTELAGTPPIAANLPVGANANKKETKAPEPVPVIELKNGVLTGTNVKVENVENDYADVKIDIKLLNKTIKEKGGNWQIPENVPPKQTILAIVAGYEDVAYLVYDNMIAVTTKDKSGGGDLFAIIPSDGSSIFTDKKAIFVTQDGSIVVTTPTMAIVGSPLLEKQIQSKYAKFFPGIPPLQDPSVRKGNDPIKVDVRSDNIVASKIEVNSKNGYLSMKPDILSEVRY